MNRIFTASLLAACCLQALPSFGQGPLVVDLGEQVMNKNIDVFNRAMTPLVDGNRTGIRLSKDYGEGVAWLKGVDFSNGTLEFDVRGENIKQHSFVGIAFHGKDNYTFDAIYLRPFQFRESDEALRSHSIQYISLPDFGWRVLREKSPGKFEQAINPSPAPDSWVHLKIVVKDVMVKVFVNGNSEPSLAVAKATDVKHGAVGFYVADTSGGDFANLTITKD